MAYKKILVDNPVCSRRFHIKFNDDDTPVEKVEARCPFCDIVIFSANEHPPVDVLRQENLVKTQTLSSYQVSACQFKDAFDSK